MTERSVDSLSFEEAFSELEETVGKLEAGDLTLDQALALFERGTALANHCNAQLDAAELQVRQLTPPSPPEYPPPNDES